MISSVKTGRPSRRLLGRPTTATTTATTTAATTATATTATATRYRQPPLGTPESSSGEIN